MMQCSQSKQGKSTKKLNQLRTRKLTLANGNTIVAYNNNTKIKNKINMIEFPMLDPEDHPQQDPIDIKLYEQQLYRKNNYRAMKAMIKAYEETKYRNNQDNMNVLGLDIRKLNCVPHQSKSALHKKSSLKKPPFKTRNISPNPRVGPSSRSQIVRKTEQSQEYYGTLKNSRSEAPKEQLGKQKLESANSVYFGTNNKKFINEYSGIINNSSANSSPGHLRQKIKKKQYLYQRLAAKEFQGPEEINLVYEKRIKSYLNMLFKLQLAHNIYINLDLKPEDISNKNRRMKYYVGPGNNSAMVKGLLKRRFWWQACDDLKQCNFVWTQVKINGIFDKQKTCEIQFENIYRKEPVQQSNEKDKKYNKTDSFKKRHINPIQTGMPSPTKKIAEQKNKKLQQFNWKILNKEDQETYQDYYQKFQRNYDKNRQYAFKAQKSNKVLLEIGQPQYPIIHNHLPNNYHLGNKKALFYNLKLYYNLVNEDPFDYIPLTFHIRNGFKDEEYKRFVTYYNRRNTIIKRQLKQIEQEYGEGYEGKKKTRNIWIVKPGENSNQGRGITVIDEIYELNSIIKHKNKNANISTFSEAKQQDSLKDSKRTYIVQMYIDRPFLYYNRKFDIRHYLLITNIFGIRRVYWYADGYIRTSSFEFRIDNFDPQIHLTNDFVQKKYPQYGKYETCNKISYEEFQRYLDSNHPNKKYSFKNGILPKMKKIATDAAKSVCLKVAPKNLQHNFQIFGMDFMIDRHFQPWLIEINTNPCLQVNCPLLDRIIPYMLEQSFKLSLDVVCPPPSQYPNTCKHYAPYINLQAFKYELIFDEREQGDDLRKLYGVYKQKNQSNTQKQRLLRKMKQDQQQMGEVEDDQWFKDDGKEVKLDDFT